LRNPIEIMGRHGAGAADAEERFVYGAQFAPIPRFTTADFTEKAGGQGDRRNS
jgi:hypothetical protein